MNTKGMLLLLFLAAIVMQGCATRVQNPSGSTPRRVDPTQRSEGEGTGIASQDLIEVTEKMARNILATPSIAHASQTPVIALLAVRNDTRFPINKQLFTMRIKAELNSKCHNAVQFVALDRIGADRKPHTIAETGDEHIEGIDNARDLTGEEPIARNTIARPQYYLTGELTGLSQASSNGLSDYVLYTFRLIEADTALEVWEDFHEIKKEGLNDVVYR